MIIKKYSKLFLSFLFVGSILMGVAFFNFLSVHAQTVDLGVEPVGQATGLSSEDIRITIARIIRVALGFLGTLAVLIILYGGYVWMTAGGNQDRIDQAKKILINAVIGLVIILSSYAFTSFIIRRLLGATNGGNVPEHCFNGIRDDDETQVDCGGSCGSCSGGSDQPNFPGGNVFYVNSLPSAGNACIQNVHLAIVFNKSVDITTLGGNIVVKKKAGEEMKGAWKYGEQENIAIFSPEGSCGAAGGNDCLESNTQYILEFKNSNAIKTKDGLLTLNCTIKAGCGPVDFVSGSSIDRTPPTIKIVTPVDKSSVASGSVVPVKLDFSDDTGLQNIAVYQNNTLISSQDIDDCKKSGTIDVSWPTSGLSAGTYLVNGFAFDWAAQKGESAAQVTLLPFHCYNDVLEADLGEKEKGPPACGGECGTCAGESCSEDNKCASGYCDRSNGNNQGICVDKARIETISPSSGAVGNYVTIQGVYFGNKVGEVYFAKVANPDPQKSTDWIKTSIIDCGSGEMWNNTQVIVEVPTGAVNGPLKLVTSQIIGRDNVSRQFIEFTNDNWGPKLNDFRITNETRPGLCKIVPEKGVSGDRVQLLGKNFGLLDNNKDYVIFGEELKASLVNNSSWTEGLIQATVPFLNQGILNVKVANNGVESNGVRFIVNEGDSEENPLISNMTPTRGVAGEYITITGKNFGSSIGSVWFKSTEDSEAILGDFTFPENCQKEVWRDNQIIVKFPKGKGEKGKIYRVQIKTVQNKISRFDLNFGFSLVDGEPAPGICNISPVSAPIPFLENQTLTINGEYFGTEPEVYFWKVGANPNTIDGRVQVPKSDIVSANNTTLQVRPPAAIATGPVVVYKNADKKISNPAQFTILDCVKNNNKCGIENYTCCAVGKEQGMCKPANELCEGTTRFSGYTWRFSTGDIPLVPHVVERCDNEINEGKNLPTPSPSTQWDNLNEGGDQYNVCRNALVTVEFSTALDQKTVNKNTLQLQKCSGIDKNNCTNPSPVDLSTDSFNLKVAQSDKGGSVKNFLSMSPEAGKWEDNTWYQVVLTKNINSAGKLPLGLAVDRPCSNRTDSAYCFVFKTDARDCQMKAVVVTPYSYWTSVLEEPIKFRVNGVAERDLAYYGNGLSDQRCIMMDTSNFNWKWITSNKSYASIFGEATGRSVKASALANTVGVGLTNPDNAVNISARAEAAGRSYEGFSPLTVDLSDPEVVDYWPKCLEACTNAEVGVRFNTTMSLKNLPGGQVNGTVQLLKCNDENCLSTVSVLTLSDVNLSEQSNYTILKLANSTENSNPLEPSTVYKVILSATSSNPNSASNQLWSSGTFRNPRSWSKPYNQVFSWRFKTKKDRCLIDRVEVNPKEYYATSIKEKVVYNVDAYSSPDMCSSEGQKLDPWQVNWSWASSDQKVATVSTYSTKGKNQYCTGACVRKGSDIPASNAIYPVCGNGKLEAGEDCENPDKNKGCGLNCLFLGSTAANCGNGVVENNLGEACDPKDLKTAIGCSKDCRYLGSAEITNSEDVNASICGNGKVGSGEACDRGIEGDVGKPSSAFNCTDKCLHTGTKLSSNWCFNNRLTRAGFTSVEFEGACNTAFSQCGDKLQSPDEDPGCDDSNAGWDNKNCTEYCLKIKDSECQANTEGCDELGRHKGSSLLYSKSSVCGDGETGVGEDAFCETALSNKHAGLIDPWSLVTGVGLGKPAGDPPSQSSDIKAVTTQQTQKGAVSDEGKFIIACGYKDDNECKEVFGDTYGVGASGCCYAKPKLISTYPSNNTTNACPNTYLEAVFDSEIDPNTLKDNLIIAKGANECKDTEDVTTLVTALENDSQNIALPWYKRALASLKYFFIHMFTDDTSAAPAKWCIAPDVGKAELLPVSDVNSTTAKIIIKLTAPLAFDSEYAVLLKNGIRTVQGVSIAKTVKPISWKFATISTICEATGVDVQPAQYSFSRANATTTLFARATTNNGSFIQGISGSYDWEYLWGPQNQFVKLSNTTSSINEITSQNANGEVDVRTSLNITANKYSNQTGIVGTGKSHIIVFLCENPWPPKDLIINGRGPYTIFPFEDVSNNNDGFDIVSNTFNNTRIPPSTLATDGYFNFSTYYCADKGSPGTLDDLPYLRGAVQVTSSIITTTSSLKRFFFTNTKNSDAIGMQVFANPKHLSVKEWYSKDKTEGGQGFVGDVQPLKINGYNAITDGSNIYVDALNYSSSTKNIYSTIYLFSINSNAEADTKSVFEQLVKNLKFNVNLSNYGYCGVDANNPSFEKVCKNDLDCGGGQVCSVVIDKLRRNYQRLRDLNSIQGLLDNAAAKNNGIFPSLVEGTFLKGQTLSVWPSWSELNNAVGSILPADPINLLGTAGTCATTTNKFCVLDGNCPNNEKCVLHEAATAWSTENRRFSFACATSSYAYRYTYSASTSTGYTIRAKLENPGITINNQDSLVSDFVNTNRFILNSPFGICNQDQEISTQNQGVCGDGQVNLNKGEECDPPGRARFGQCVAGKVKVDVCTTNCKWTPSSTPEVTCSYLSKCGNGKVEIGETCDDGNLNGRYNHCSKDCKWPPADPPGYCGDGAVQNAYEICDTNSNVTGKKGMCVSGLSWGVPCDTDAECKKKDDTTNYLLGTCRTIEESKVRYAKQKTDSCNWDCQSPGPYCGDGIIQTEFGEECETSDVCSVGGKQGKKYCNAACKLTDISPIGWWSFDDGESKKSLQGLKLITLQTFLDKISNRHATCISPDCPSLVSDGKIQNALEFNGGNSLNIATPNNSLMPLVTFSIETWIKPTAYDSQWVRILEKGGYKSGGGGYGFQFNPTSQLGFTLWGVDENKPTLEVYSKNPVPLNEWTHVVGTFEKKGIGQIAKLYLNGVLDNIISIASTTSLLVNNSRDLIIGRASTGGENFKGTMDELKIYDRALAPTEVLDRYSNKWACSLTSTPSGTGGGVGSCGDGKVDGGEACDRAGDNGIACVPKYGESCSYCSGDCRNVIDVQSNEYCGNGRVEGNESCEIDRETNLIYSSINNSGTNQNKDAIHQGYQVLSCSEEAQTTSTYKKGSKSCVNKCLALQSNCIVCGITNDEDRAGVAVQGSIVNALDPLSNNPLLGSQGVDGKIDLTLSAQNSTNRVGRIYWSGGSSSTYYLKPPTDDPYNPTIEPVKLNSNSICSLGDAPNYRMFLNGDDTHSFSFPVLTKGPSSQYDLVLSPVISRAARADDIRIVTTWINSAPNFYSGFVIPAVGASSTIERTATSTGSNYFNNNSLNGIWYHGFAYTPTKTNIRSFTIDTSQMIDDEYLFYIRIPQSRLTDPGIYRYKDTSKLKVDIYVSENDSDPRHYALPIKTFYLSNAGSSDNASAPYWHVFNIKRDTRVNPEDRIIPVNKIFTDWKRYLVGI